MYLLGYIAAMPLLGRASDRFGRKLVLQVSLAAVHGRFGGHRAGRSLRRFPPAGRRPHHPGRGQRCVCCRSPSRWAPICGRSATAPVCSAASGPHRSSAACWARCTGSSSSVLFHDWRYVFWINVPLTLIAMVMIQFSLPSHDRSRGAGKDRPGRWCAAGRRAGSCGDRAVQPPTRRQTGAAELRVAVGDRCGRRRRWCSCLGALRAHPADRPGRRAFPAFPGRAGRVASPPVRR